MTGALHITSSWGNCSWVIAENCSHSNVGRVDFLFSSFFCIAYNNIYMQYTCTAANPHFFFPTSPQITQFRKVTENARKKEIRWCGIAEGSGHSLCSALHSWSQKGPDWWPVISAKTRTGKELMSDFRLTFLTSLARASTTISWADGSSGHILTSPHFAKPAFVFLVPFTCCQRIRWVKRKPVPASQDHCRRTADRGSLFQKAAKT